MKTILLLLNLILTITVHARTWTDLKGRKVEATVVQVKPNQTVTLKTSHGKTITVPFSTFVPADVKILKNLLVQPKNLSDVPWEKMNEIFGVEIWQDNSLWDDPTAETAKRMHLRKESKTAFLENYRAYPMGKINILNSPAFAVALYGGTDYVNSISIVFLNLGDISIPDDQMSSDLLKEINKKIKVTGERLCDRLTSILGEPQRDSLGKSHLREKVWRWDWNGHAVMVSLQEGKYVALRIMPIDRADRGGRSQKINDDTLKARLASCVERKSNGDVLIKNVPMIDQGPKGYCSPATWERNLRFMGIPADMYLLALAAHTGVGGGTVSSEIIRVSKNIISTNGRKLKEINGKVSIRSIAKYIDQGLPIMWRLMSTPSFQQAANNNTARRNGKEIHENNSGQAEDTGSGGHICLIIGYNKKTNEVAISDSWGARFAVRWVPLANIQTATNGKMSVITW